MIKKTGRILIPGGLITEIKKKKEHNQGRRQGALDFFRCEFKKLLFRNNTLEFRLGGIRE